MYTKFQRDWLLGSVLKFDHKFSPGNLDKKVNQEKDDETMLKLVNIIKRYYISSEREQESELRKT